MNNLLNPWDSLCALPENLKSTFSLSLSSLCIAFKLNWQFDRLWEALLIKHCFILIIITCSWLSMRYWLVLYPLFVHHVNPIMHCFHSLLCCVRPRLALDGNTLSSDPIPAMPPWLTPRSFMSLYPLHPFFNVLLIPDLCTFCLCLKLFEII